MALMGVDIFTRLDNTVFVIEGVFACHDVAWTMARGDDRFLGILA